MSEGITCRGSCGKSGEVSGWVLDDDPDSPFEGMWVHNICGRPSPATLEGTLDELGWTPPS